MFIPVSAAFTVVVPPERVPAIVVVPPVLVIFKFALLFTLAPCSAVIPPEPEFVRFKSIPLRSPDAVFLKVIPPFAALFLIFSPGTGAGVPPCKIGPLSPPRLPAIVIEPFPDLFSIFISA